MRSGPAAPLFDSTFVNASCNRATTLVIVAIAAASSVFDDKGASRFADRRGRRTAWALAPRTVGVFGLSADSLNNRNCCDCCETGSAFPPRRLSPVVGTVFRRRCGTTPRSDFCRVISFGSFVLWAYRLRGARQISLGKNMKLEQPPGTNTIACPTEIGRYRCVPVNPHAETLYGSSLSLGCCSTYGFHCTCPRGKCWCTQRHQCVP